MSTDHEIAHMDKNEIVEARREVRGDRPLEWTNVLRQAVVHIDSTEVLKENPFDRFFQVLPVWRVRRLDYDKAAWQRKATAGEEISADLRQQLVFGEQQCGVLDGELLEILLDIDYYSLQHDCQRVEVYRFIQKYLRGRGAHLDAEDIWCLKATVKTIQSDIILANIVKKRTGREHIPQTTILDHLGKCHVALQRLLKAHRAEGWSSQRRPPNLYEEADWKLYRSWMHTCLCAIDHASDSWFPMIRELKEKGMPHSGLEGIIGWDSWLGADEEDPAIKAAVTELMTYCDVNAGLKIEGPKEFERKLSYARPSESMHDPHGRGKTRSSFRLRGLEAVKYLENEFSLPHEGIHRSGEVKKIDIQFVTYLIGWLAQVAKEWDEDPTPLLRILVDEDVDPEPFRAALQRVRKILLETDELLLIKMATQKESDELGAELVEVVRGKKPLSEVELSPHLRRRRKLIAQLELVDEFPPELAAAKVAPSPPYVIGPGQEVRRYGSPESESIRVSPQEFRLLKMFESADVRSVRIEEVMHRTASSAIWKETFTYRKKATIQQALRRVNTKISTCGIKYEFEMNLAEGTIVRHSIPRSPSPSAPNSPASA